MKRLWGDPTVAFQYLRGAYKQIGAGFLHGRTMTGQGGMASNQKL